VVTFYKGYIVSSYSL